ncbi:hypothetical protein QLX08_006178 [Tetragonisca angustula]|uniref:Uncharacterized protein n=1 Tax=Tetragonisca angustula TaxID=166442 RepID=A0AAW0ZUS0_9HYME
METNGGRIVVFSAVSSQRRIVRGSGANRGTGREIVAQGRIDRRRVLDQLGELVAEGEGTEELRPGVLTKSDVGCLVSCAMGSPR